MGPPDTLTLLITFHYLCLAGLQTLTAKRSVCGGNLRIPNFLGDAWVLRRHGTEQNHIDSQRLVSEGLDPPR